METIDIILLLLAGINMAYWLPTIKETTACSICWGILYPIFVILVII